MNRIRRDGAGYGRIAGGWAVSICLVLTGCLGPKAPPRYLDEGERHLIRLERVEEPERYDHPAQIDLETFQAVLRSIVVRNEVSFLNRLLAQRREARGPAFTPEEVDLLGDRLKSALALAAPDERVAFFLTSKKNTLSTTVTSGVAYVRGTELHLVFGNGRTSLLDHRTHLSRDRPLYSYDPGSFEILPQPHQRKLPSEGRRVEAIAVDYTAVTGPLPEPAVSTEGEAPLSSEGAKLEAQLRLLKKLRDEALITEEEYTEKKAALLEAFGSD